MTLTLELTPAEERELQARAAREGVNVEELRPPPRVALPGGTERRWQAF